MKPNRLFWTFACIPALCGMLQAQDGIAILPGKILLHGPEARQRILIEEMREGLPVGQVAGGAEISSSDAAVFRLEGGFARPAGNGKAVLAAAAGGRKASAEVEVTGMDRPFEWSFRNHVQSVLTKAGCNSGACHGAASGKNGFQLSLRGYDAEGDFYTLTRQARGRRIVPSDPGRSLMLLKPTGTLPHKGGVRFEAGSLEYRVISEWIAAGTPAPRSEDARIESLEILPRQAILKPGKKEQLAVLARFSDGHVEEVTRWVKYTATNSAVVQTDDVGLVTVTGAGESAITAWYLSRIAVATVTVPFENQLAAEVFRGAERRNFIDDRILDKLEKLKIPPSPSAGDDEFIRRASLDAIGVLPTAGEVQAFLTDASAGKRDALIEKLLARPEFVDYWAYKWSDLLLVNSEKLSQQAMWAYYGWIRDSVAANRPWDRMARELLTAKGSTLENGAANFYLLHTDPLEMSETTSLAFLGMSINCARCHNHPLEKWTNGQYYSMANLFARVRVKDLPGSGNRMVFTVAEGDLVQPLTGRPQAPAPLDGEALPMESPEDRRVHLARWLTSPENPYFSRSIANRVWANFMGVGLVQNIDDMRLTNPASNEELLGALAGYLAAERFDLKALMRAILQSKAYQRSSRPVPGNEADRRYYSHYYPRRLMAEVLLDAVSQVTAAPTAFPGYPPGWRALQLPDSNVSSYFLKSFGRPERHITCECERAAEPSMTQVLHISNGDTINQKLETAGNRIEKLLAAGTAGEKIIEELYLSSLSRFPKAEESRKILEILAGAPPEQKKTSVQDLFWSVLSSTEFLFNH